MITGTPHAGACEGKDGVDKEGADLFQGTLMVQVV